MRERARSRSDSDGPAGLTMGSGVDSAPGLVVLQRGTPSGGVEWVHGRDPASVLSTDDVEAVPALMADVEEAQRRGQHALGFLCYEAAPAFDSCLETHSPEPGMPLAWFGIYEEIRAGVPSRETAPFVFGAWRSAWDGAIFARKVERAREAIASGETYQVNLTFPWHATFRGDPWACFRAQRLGQAARHQAYIDTGNRVILSASPELFFRLDGGRIHSRPMKGTAPLDQPRALLSAKNRAENLMIVDMIRNDLGKVAEPGSVRVRDLFSTEAYPSLLQLTSTVEARGEAGLLEWLRALFPCASITGAPKRSTMQWIRELESGPRGVYTGAIGGAYRDGTAEFNVAIRTAVVDRGAQSVRYDTGCGILWDSEAADEWAESRLKGSVMFEPAEEFLLVETMRGEPGRGIRHWSYHRKRLLGSAGDLGFALREANVESERRGVEASLTEPSRVRLSADVDGRLDWVVSPLPPVDRRRTFAVDSRATPKNHPALAHKTTRRGVFEQARRRCPDADDVLLVNEDGELMGFTIGSLLVELDGRWATPPLASGCLAGTTRERLLDEGTVREAVLREEDLERATAVEMCNAVRGRVVMTGRRAPAYQLAWPVVRSRPR